MNYEALVAFVGEILHRKDPYNHHGENVGRLAGRIARMLDRKIDQEHLKMIVVGSNLHDMGKMLLDDTLLNFPRRLTAGEYEIMKSHTTRGFQIANTLQWDPIIRDIIQYHHENIDGSGYPRGLKGEDIPWAARIVRVVDTFDSITNHRAYRRADTPYNAFTIIEAEAGRVFDMVAVGALKAVLTENNLLDKEHPANKK
jgi:putative nucleotidyltransferase with HDIG domain